MRSKVFRLSAYAADRRCFYYFLMAVIVIRYETTATARWTSPFIIRAFFNDTITVAVWTGFHVLTGCSTETGSDAGKVFFRASSSAFSSRLRSPLLRSSPWGCCCGPATIRFSEPPRPVAHYSHPPSRSRSAYSPSPAEETRAEAHLGHVCFTPESDMCGASTHVRCSPENDRKSGHWTTFQNEIIWRLATK